MSETPKKAETVIEAAEAAPAPAPAPAKAPISAKISKYVPYDRLQG